MQIVIYLFLYLNIYQIERLYARFTSLDKQNHGYLTREDFLRYI